MMYKNGVTKSHGISPREDSMALASRQKHQLKPLILNLTLGTNIIEQVREHRFLGLQLMKS